MQDEKGVTLVNHQHDARRAVAAGASEEYVTVLEASNGFRELQAICFMLSVRAGWWKDLDANDPYVFGTKLALVHSEISEAMEGGRKGLMDDHLPHRKMEEVELADAVIRIMDLAAARNLDVAGAIVEKLAYNITRADHKIDARAEAGARSSNAAQLEGSIMDNQHRQIKWYRELTKEEISLMNEIKQHGVELGELVERLRQTVDVDGRWVSIGATDLQTGLMALTRAVARPTFF